MYIDLSATDARLHRLTGLYTVHTTYNERPSYKHADNNYFMFYANDPNRWILEDVLGKTHNENGIQYHGYIRYEGDTYRPENVGRLWSQVWNANVVDPNVVVKAAGKCICYLIN